MSGALNARGLRNELVETLKRAGALGAEPAIERAFRVVPRELFLPGVPLSEVYSDAAIVTKVEDGVGVSSSSQPAIMALMLRQLAVEPGQRVLEIGAGTGYNAALLRELVGPDGAVVTVDIDPEVAGWARAARRGWLHRCVYALRGRRRGLAGRRAVRPRGADCRRGRHRARLGHATA